MLISKSAQNQKMGQSQRGVEEGGFESGGVTTHTKQEIYLQALFFK